MRKLYAWLGMAMLAVCVSPAYAGDPLKPYVVLAFDTSGSMNEATSSGQPSCGGANTRMNHARCAVSKIVNSYGDMVFALGRFRTTMNGTTTPSSFPVGCCVAGPDVGANGSCAAGPECNPSNNMFELLTPLVDGNNETAGVWTNLTGNTCTAAGSDPEMWVGSGNTPLEGTLNGVKRYWQGLQADNYTIWPSNMPGFGPIANDPTKDVFLGPQNCSSAANCTVNCCLEQCRPYITILMTDGAETCEGTPANGAASLLRTDVGGKRYRIETKPIGFGIAPGNAQIESIAHAGGAPDAAGVNEGYYASDEAGLQLAISSILDDAIRTEVCNGRDDDCDVLIDEDFPNKGNTCDNGALGTCRTTGTLVCRADGTGTQCNAPAGPAPGVETCNTRDDDCDGRIDEGLTCNNCVPTGEACNNLDDDCDTRVDEGLSRQCGTGTCLGTETCVAGVFQGCTAETPQNETCNGEDDNCDGVADGFNLACSNRVTPGGPATDNPGGQPNSACSMLGAACICHPGTKSCPANGNGTYGACTGEQLPLTEVCNNLDDDCDGRIDEGTGGADCSSNCQTGTTVCENGVLQCDSVSATTDTSCDGIDEDCDGVFDEDWVSSGACGAGMVCNGQEKCINGNEVCEGTPIGVETCDCADNDCDTIVDENVNCGGNGSTCTGKPFCQCARPCQAGEFPCAVGQICLEHPTTGTDLCVLDPCAGIQCPPVNGNAQFCEVQVNSDSYTGACVDVCSTVTCNPGTVCFGPTGECKADDCTTFPDRCVEGQTCRVPAGGGLAECVTNPCFGVECPSGQNCVNGQCFGSCADVDCPDGERCRMGVCETDPCGGPCPFGQACNDASGTCVTNGCEFINCPEGQWCNPNVNGGTCEPDACADLPKDPATGEPQCPNPTEVCLGGTCYDPTDFAPDGGTPERITTGGGGGCSTGGESSTGGFVLGLAFLMMMRRRRVVPASSRIGGPS